MFDLKFDSNFARKVAETTIGTMEPAEPGDAINFELVPLDDVRRRVRGSGVIARVLGRDLWPLDLNSTKWTLKNIDEAKMDSTAARVAAGLADGSISNYTINVETREFIHPVTASVRAQRDAAIRFASLLKRFKSRLAKYINAAAVQSKSGVLAVDLEEFGGAYQFIRIDPQMSRGRYVEETAKLVDVYAELGESVPSFQPRAYADYPSDTPETMYGWARRIVDICSAVNPKVPVVPWISPRTISSVGLGGDQFSAIIRGLRDGGAAGAIVWISNGDTLNAWDFSTLAEAFRVVDDESSIESEMNSSE